MAEEIKNEAPIANDGRRYSLMVMQTSGMLDMSGIIVEGRVFGTVKKDDSVYIITTNLKTVVTTVKGIEIIDGNKSQIAEEATDEKVYLQLDLTDTALVPKYSVITSVRPQTQVDVKKSAENPVVSALLYELRDNGKDKHFFSWLIYSIVHAHFITPIKLEGQPEDNGDGTATFKKDTKMGFYMLKVNPDVKAPVDPDKFVLPIFTDWNEIHKWADLKKDDEKVRTMIVRFQDVIKFIEAPQFDGFVINPFSKNQITVNKKLIASIVANETYQKEFVKKDSDKNITEDKIKADTKVALGVPKPTEEVNNIRKELKTYGETHEEVNHISFMIKIEQTGKQRYLIDLGLTNNEIAKTHMQGIYNAIKPYAISIKDIEFTVRGTIKAIDDIADQNATNMLIYSA